MAVIDVPVKGMTCQACEVRISKALRTVPGVLRVKVSVRRGIARVHTDAHVPRGRLHKAIQRAGDLESAARCYRAAAARTTSVPEQRYLATRAARIHVH